MMTSLFSGKKAKKITPVTETEILEITNDVVKDSENISKYLFDQNSVLRFSRKQILALSVISIHHCEYLLALQALSHHPEFTQIKSSLINIKQSFQTDLYYQAASLKQ